jgi:hypothetical protein
VARRRQIPFDFVSVTTVGRSAARAAKPRRNGRTTVSPLACQRRGCARRSGGVEPHGDLGVINMRFASELSMRPTLGLEAQAR